MKYKPTLLAALLAAAMALGAAGCAQDEPVSNDTADAVTTAVPATAASPETTVLPETAPGPETTAAPETTIPAVQPVQVNVSNITDGFSVRTVGLPAGIERQSVFAYDETHLLFYLQKGDQLRLALFDTTAGKFAAECSLTVKDYLGTVHYSRDALTLFNFSVEGEKAVLDEAYAVRYADGRLTAESVTREAYPYAESRISSPDGKYQVYRVIEDGVGRAGVDLHLPDGTVKRLFTQYAVGDTLPNGSTVSHFGGTAYVPICFLDNTRLLYRMYGYESGGGFGIYDVATGEDRTFLAKEGYSYRGTHNGAVYVAEPGISTYEYVAYWKVAPDGQATRIHTIDPNEHYRVCLGSCWMSAVLGGKDLHLTIHAPDLDGTLAEIALDAPMGVWTENYGQTGRAGDCYVHAVGDTLYLFAPGVIESVYTGQAAAPVTTTVPETTAVPEPVTTAPVITSAPPETTAVLPESTDRPPVNPYIPPATAVSEGIGINFASDIYTVRTVPLPGTGSDRSYFGIDERYILFYTYDYSPEPAAKNQQLHLFDRKLGAFVSTYDLDSSFNTYFHSTYFRGDVFYITDSDVAYAVDYADGILRLSPADVAWTREDCRVTSPGGQYMAYRVTEGRTNEERREHIDVRLSDGSTKRLLAGEQGIYYCPVGFLNDSDLIYTVSGEKRDHDFGIINMAGGHYVPTFNREYHIYGITDGTVYLRNQATRELCRMTDSGSTLTVIGTLPPEDSGKVWRFTGNSWEETILQGDTRIVTLNTLDPGDAMLARLEVTEERNRDLVWLPDESGMCIIGRGLTASRTPAVEGNEIRELADGFAVRTVTLPGTGTQYCVLELDDRYQLFVTYNSVKGSTTVTNQEIHLFDREAGRFTDTVTLTETRLLDQLLHDGNTTYLYAQSGLPGEVYLPVAAVSLTYGAGGLDVLSALPGQIKPLWMTLTSPDGKYTVEQDYLGDVYAIGPDGSRQRILDRLGLGDVLPNGRQVDLADVISYQPLAFVDNTRLLVGMGGYEWSRGFMLLDVTSGQITNFSDCAGFTLLGYTDGMIYAAKPGEAAYSTDSFWQITLDGKMTKLYAFPAEEQSGHEATLDYRFCGDAWVLARRDGYNAEPVTLTAWSRNFSERLATVELSAKVYSSLYWLTTDDALCLISRDLPDSPEPVETAEYSQDLKFTYRDGVIYDDRTFHVSVDLPTVWMPKEYFPLVLFEGEQERITLHDSLYLETFDEFRTALAESPAGTWDFDHPITGTTRSGHRYVGYLQLSLAVQTGPLERDWYLFCLDVGEGYTYRFGVLTHPDDDSDYFERVLRPVIESVTVTLGEPVRPYGTEIFTHRIFTSSTTLRFYIDEADPRYFAVRCANTAAGRDMTLDLAIPEGLTYDSARPIYAGGGGGSGECEFIVEFRQGDTVTYVSFNNFAYTDSTNWLDFAAKVVDAEYVNELRQAMPYLFH